MSKYKVLWIEDEPEKNVGFYQLAAEEGIELVEFKTAKSGIYELTTNLDHYDFILLDAKGYKNDEDEAQGLKGIKWATRKIHELRSKRYIPYCVFTGKADQQRVADFKEDIEDEVEVFIKGRDVREVIKYIKDEADKTELTQIRHEFREVLDVCNEKYIGERNRGRLLGLLEFLKGKERYDEEKFNTIRKLLEAVFYSCKENQLMPNDFFNQKGEVNITWALLFLQGKGVNLPEGDSVKCNHIPMPDVISSHAYRIKDLTNSGSHDEKGKVKPKITELLNNINKPYIIKVLIFQLLDILLWSKKYIDNGAKNDWNYRP